MTTFARLLPHPTTARALRDAVAASDLIGEPDRVVRRVGSLASTAGDVLAFCDADAASAAERLELAHASVVLVRIGTRASPRSGRTLIVVEDVRAAFIDIVQRLLPGAERPCEPAPGADDAACIDGSAQIAASACIGAGVVIGTRTRVGAGAIIYADCEIGSDCVIGPNAVIGWVGLSYHDRTDGRRSFFPHLAGVRIGNRVDVGANACICRGMLSHTTIGDDARIGSLVYISHGVAIGARAWLSAGAAIAGHATIGERTLLGIGSIVIDNVNLEPGVRTGGGSVVTRHAGAGSNVQGVPAQQVAAMRRFGPTSRD
jgi:UDP-3-O-[3-hydroxymyristoyl] glucosamine N-acyltransferase